MSHDRIKVLVTVTLTQVYNIPQKLDGSSIFVAWRRGSNRLSGITKRALVKDGKAIWGEPIEVECPFVRDSDTGLFGSKSMSFIIKEDQLGRNRSQKSLAKATIDLADHVKSDPTESHTARFKLGKKTKLQADPPLTMSYTIRVVWLKFNDRVLTTADGASEKHAILTLDEDLLFEVESDSEVFSTKDSISVGSLSDEENVEQLIEDGDVLLFPDECDDAPTLRRVVEQLEDECFQRMKTLRSRNAEVHRLKGELKKRKRLLEAVDAELRRVKEQLAKARVDHLEDARREIDATVAAASLTSKRGSKRAAVVELEEALRSRQAYIERLQAEADLLAIKEPADRPDLETLERKIDEYTSTILALNQKVEEKDWSLRAYEKRLGLSPEQNALVRESSGTEMEGELDRGDELKRELEQLESALEVRSLIEKNIYRVEPGFLAGAELARSHVSQRRRRRERKLLGDRTLGGKRGEGRGSERESGVSVSAENIIAALLEWGVLPNSSAEGLYDVSDRLGSVGTDVLDAIESVSRHADPIMLSYWLSTTSSLLSFLSAEFDLNNDRSSSKWLVDEDSRLSERVSELGLQLKELVAIVFKRLLQQFYRDASSVVVAAVLELPALKIGKNVTSTAVIPSKAGNLSTTGTLLPLLDRYLTLLSENNIPSPLTQQFVYECFGFVNATVFNHLLAHKELCTCATGFQLKIELSQFEQWLTERGLKSDTLSLTLGHAEQAANVLFMDKGWEWTPSCHSRFRKLGLTLCTQGVARSGCQKYCLPLANCAPDSPGVDELLCYHNLEHILFRAGMTVSPGDGHTLCWRIGQIFMEDEISFSTWCPRLRACQQAVLRAYQKYMAVVDLILLCSRTTTGPASLFQMLPLELVDAILKLLHPLQWSAGR